MMTGKGKNVKNRLLFRYSDFAYNTWAIPVNIKIYPSTAYKSYRMRKNDAKI